MSRQNIRDKIDPLSLVDSCHTAPQHLRLQNYFRSFIHSSTHNMQYPGSNTPAYIAHLLWRKWFEGGPELHGELHGELQLNVLGPPHAHSFSFKLIINFLSKTHNRSPMEPILKNRYKSGIEAMRLKPRDEEIAFQVTLDKFVAFMKSNEWSRSLCDQGGSEDEWRRQHFVAACEAIVGFAMGHEPDGCRSEAILYNVGWSFAVMHSFRIAIVHLVVQTFGRLDGDRIWLFAAQMLKACRRAHLPTLAQIHDYITISAKEFAQAEIHVLYSNLEMALALAEST